MMPNHPLNTTTLSGNGDDAGTSGSNTGRFRLVAPLQRYDYTVKYFLGRGFMPRISNRQPEPSEIVDEQF